MNLDKSKWKKVRFGDVVFEKKITVDAKNCGLERYIAGEHMASEDLHLRSWGIIGDDYLGPAFHRKFEKGDILYGSRRTYLKKVAIADFDGVTANTTFVLRENTDLVVPGFIPFLMLSDVFTEHSVRNSKGSVNPYINYKDIAQFQFLLPPKDQQARLAELLWAGDAVVEGYQKLEKQLVDFTNLFIDLLFLHPQYHFPHYQIKPIHECCFFQTGIAKGKRYDNNDDLISVPYIRVANVQDGYLDLSEVKEIIVKKSEIERYSIIKNDILITEGGDFDKVGRGTIWSGQISPCIHQNHVFAIRPKSDQLKPSFLVMQTKSTYGKDYFLRCAKKTSNLASINSSQVKAFKVILPPLTNQSVCVRKFEKLNDRLNAVQSQIAKSKSLLNGLLNQIFTP